MLHLQCESPPRWRAQVDADLPTILIDHAHCEKKAAGTALNLIFAYVENIELCREMTAIVNGERPERPEREGEGEEEQEGGEEAPSDTTAS